MGKRVKHLLAAAILAACLLAQAGVCYGEETAAQSGQAAGESQADQNSQTAAVQNGQETGDVNPPAIEQVYVNLPEVTVYGSGWPEEGMEAFLGQESLTYEGKTTFAQTGEPVYYYILLDVSNSMPDSYFRGVKEAIRSFEGKINTQDRMALYTFGETVELKLAEEHSPEETQAVLESLANRDERTLMFEAVRMASDRAAQVAPEVCRRRVLLVISDGEDFNIGSTGVNEAQECLKKTGIPAYAFAMKDTAREHINSFGEFARTSGGTLTVFDDQQAPALLDTFPAYMAAGEVLEWRSGSNRQTNRMENVSLRTGDNRTVSREVMVSRHIRDEEAPRLVFVEQTGDAQIAVEFSEAVEGADNPSSYMITRRDLKKSKKKKDKEDQEEEDQNAEDQDAEDQDAENGEPEDTENQDAEDGEEDSGTVIPVLSVATDKEIPGRMLLSFSEDLEPGRYTISCPGIRDSSMEQNPVENQKTIRVEQRPLMTRIFQAVKDWYWIGLILAAAALAAVILRAMRKVKQGRGVVYVDGKPVMAADVELHKHVSIQEERGMPFYLRVSVKGNRPEDMTLHMNGSFIVGRAQICNLYFDDKRMSRQHFVLEWDGQNMYVTDLETTNGTQVNQVPIHQKRRLQQNDVISAGSVDMTIRW